MASASVSVVSSLTGEVAPGGFRMTVLSAAKRFKSTWVELGKLLVRVRDEGLFQEWGFESFESYCYKELHIRKQTALKLTRSYQFLDKHEPKVMREGDLADRAPAFEVVEVLADAEERGQLSAAEYQSVRDAIWSPERPANEVKRELSERFPRPAPEPSDDAQLKRLAGLAKKLASDLRACRKVPNAVRERAAALAEDVEELAALG
jgi:hypothetical protein